MKINNLEKKSTKKIPDGVITPERVATKKATKIKTSPLEEKVLKQSKKVAGDIDGKIRNPDTQKKSRKSAQLIQSVSPESLHSETTFDLDDQGYETNDRIESGSINNISSDNEWEHFGEPEVNEKYDRIIEDQKKEALGQVDDFYSQKMAEEEERDNHWKIKEFGTTDPSIIAYELKMRTKRGDATLIADINPDLDDDGFEKLRQANVVRPRDDIKKDKQEKGSWGIWKRFWNWAESQVPELAEVRNTSVQISKNPMDPDGYGKRNPAYFTEKSKIHDTRKESWFKKFLNEKKNSGYDRNTIEQFKDTMNEQESDRITNEGIGYTDKNFDLMEEPVTIRSGDENLAKKAREMNDRLKNEPARLAEQARQIKENDEVLQQFAARKEYKIRGAKRRQKLDDDLTRDWVEKRPSRATNKQSPNAVLEEVE